MNTSMEGRILELWRVKTFSLLVGRKGVTPGAPSHIHDWVYGPHNLTEPAFFLIMQLVQKESSS